MSTPFDLTGSTHAPGQALNLLTQMSAYEKSLVDADGRRIEDENGNLLYDNITISPDEENNVIEVTYTCPVKIVGAENGSSFQAVDYLPTEVE